MCRCKGLSVKVDGECLIYYRAGEYTLGNYRVGDKPVGEFRAEQTGMGKCK